MPGARRLRRLLLSSVPAGWPGDDHRSGRHLRLGRPLGGLPRRAECSGQRLHQNERSRSPMNVRIKGHGTRQLPWWVSGDLNAAFGLGFNVLVNVLVLSTLCIDVVQIPQGDVFGVILPALGIQLLIGNGYYTYLARRLARRENRSDVCAMPYGPSVPHMFIVTFVIMLPIYLSTRDPIRAWQAGLAWSFIIGLIVLIGAFVGPYIRRFTPRAALLG